MLFTGMGYQIAFFMFLFMITCKANKECGCFPHIDNKAYLEHLSNHVKNKDAFGVLVILGPKDAGKSEGLSTQQVEWEKSGYLIIDINLKGLSHIASGEDVMLLVSKKLHKELEVFSYWNYLQLYHETIKVCLNPHASLWNWVCINIQYIISVFGTFVAFIVGSNYIDKLKQFYDKLREFYDKLRQFCGKCCYLLWILIILIAILLVFLIIMLWIDPTLIYMFLEPYDVSVTNGDWTSLICFLNVIATMHPDHKPILILKEIVNMEPQCLKECMRSLEQVKEGKIYYPIIIETSDNMWFSTDTIKKSISVFQTYYISEMSYSDGYDDLVASPLYMWTPEQYDIIFKNLGGHTGSHRLLWRLVTCYNYSVEGAIDYMISVTRSQLLGCILQSSTKSNLTAPMIIQQLRELKEENYMYMVRPNDVTSVMKYLFGCNVLFFNGTNIYPQKKLMEIAIEHYVNISSS